MEANLTQILPMYPTNYDDLGTFKKEVPVPYLRTIVTAAAAAGFLGLFAASALCVDRLAEIERQQELAARI